jgi:hypothetical protein
MRRLERLVGEWEVLTAGVDAGPFGRTTFGWMDGGGWLVHRRAG